MVLGGFKPPLNKNMILNLDDYLGEETRQNWCYKDTPTAFPELTQEVRDKISSARDEERIAIRAKYLEEWIEKLS